MRLPPSSALNHAATVAKSSDEGDLVVDPFAGSNTTGAVAERLGRRWIAAELVEEYLEASKFRFGE